MYSLDFSFVLFENDFLALLPELFLVSSSCVLLLSGVLITTSASKPLWLSSCTIISLWVLALTLILVCKQPIELGYFFYNCLVQDALTLFLKKLLILGAALSLLISIRYNQMENINPFELNVLQLLSIGSMLFMIQSADLISIYLAIELQSLCFYVMAALKTFSPFSSEAGLKYFLLGAFSSGILLLGSSLVYGFTGVTELSQLTKIFSCGISAGGDELVQWCPDSLGVDTKSQAGELNDLNAFFFANALTPMRGCELGMIFILVAFLFKITAVPFHIWAPDVYEGAPTTVTAFFSIVPKVALLCLAIRLLDATHLQFTWGWQKILVVSSCASMVLGSFAALSQNKIKRLLVWSSIGHVGYMCVALSLDSLLGAQCLSQYLLIYVSMTAALFGIFLLHTNPAQLEGMAHSKDRLCARIKYITDLNLLSTTNPTLALCLAVTLFSLAGIPPLAGFYAKASLFLAALSSSQYVLAVVGVLTSVISSYYYMRLVKVMYFETKQRPLTLARPQKCSTLTIAFLALFSALFMVFPAPLFAAAHYISACVI